MDEFWLQQIYKEGKGRYEDGEFLSKKRNSDSGYLLKLLGFELLLKAALYIDKNKENITHNYKAIYHTLSRDVKAAIISEAKIISQIFDIDERIEKLLENFSDNFIRLRYPFDSYKGFTETEYREYGKLYADLGCPDHESEFEYYPEELRGLFLALEKYVRSGTFARVTLPESQNTRPCTARFPT